MKTVWITALAKDQARVGATAATLKRYGIQSQGHFWLDEPDKATARAAADGALAAHADMWLVLADAASMAAPGIRYGLSLMAATLAAARGKPLPLVWLWPGDALPEAAGQASLPTLLQGGTAFAESNPSWPAKVIAAAARPVLAATGPLSDYRLTLWGDENLGQWLELGPLTQTLAGFAFGITGGIGDKPAQILFQAVGARGGLPEKTVLEYAQQGLQMQAGAREFSSWAVRNVIDPGQSYFVRLAGCPSALLCMPYPDGDDAEATVIELH